MADENPDLIDPPIDFSEPTGLVSNSPLSVLAPDAFDLESWLDGTVYSGKRVEIFNRTDRLAEVAELTEFLEQQKAAQKENERQLIAPQSIADEPLADLIAGAEAQVDAIVESLKGTGIVFDLVGISPGERDVLEARVARGLKPRAAVYEVDGEEKLLVTEAEGSGRAHPRFNDEVSYALAEKSIKQAALPGGRVMPPFDREALEKLKGRVHGFEWRRLMNAVFEVNYFSYDIDSKVTLDF